MSKIGILAYGSLIDNPEREIEPFIINRICDVKTPFNVEFARTSKSRGGAPTLVPVDGFGASVNAQILLLKDGVSEEQAKNMLWRREVGQVGSSNAYNPPPETSVNHVFIEGLKDFYGVDLVLYTRIGINIEDLNPKRLANLAIESAKSDAGAQKKDGITYLMAAKRNGIFTPLIDEYEKEVLSQMGVRNLEEALGEASKSWKMIQGWIRPLSFPSLGGFPFGPSDQIIDSGLLVKDLSHDWSDNFLENIRSRYHKLTTDELDVFMVPANEEILEKLIWPLKAAKQNYILGTYLGCISLCGMVCEMGTIFLFELAQINARDKKLDIDQQKRLFGRTFEKLGQERRIEVLVAYKLLSGDMVENLDLVRRIRRKYLHFLSQNYSSIEGDAEAAYRASLQFIKKLVALPLGDGGTIKIPEHLSVYLKDQINS